MRKPGNADVPVGIANEKARERRRPRRHGE
jgi:hypothetical protein